MLARPFITATVVRNAAALAWLALVCFATAPAAHAQFVQRSVAGVWIDAEGLLRNPQLDERNELKRIMEQALQQAPGAMRGHVELRKISLRRLEAALAENLKQGVAMPDEMKYLAGLQKIQYILVYPESNDIVLAGPGEGWKVNGDGEVVGLTTGRPVMLLDDLLVALRSAETARQSAISCSIDPTAEGLTQLQAFVKKIKGPPANIKQTVSDIETTLGPQVISVTGVPASSHFARVIVAADYKMKRLAMNFEESPVKGMPSFLDMMKAGPRGMGNMLPRWWLAPNYDTLLASPDGLAFEIRGAGVKTVAEEDFLTETGARERTAKANPVAKKWADNMTAHYDELSQKDVVFGQLRNCMDLAIVGALVAKEHLAEKASFSMPLLLNSADLKVMEFNAPKNVSSQASVLKKGSNWLISASGGVQIESWSLVDKPQSSADIAPIRAKAAAEDATAWWWN